jgi:hypothetical protein
MALKIVVNIILGKNISSFLWTWAVSDISTIYVTILILTWQ